MSDALIGYTGLVGGNLLRHTTFHDLYRSTNIAEIAGRHYDLLVCAGMPAEKWRANQDPNSDRHSLHTLQAALAQVTARQVVLISTVDVFATPVEVDEATPIDSAGLHAYGLHRYELEQWTAARFDTLIVRLPGLFGPRLKKNIIFDLLHDNAVDRVHADSQFQFYNLDHLWSDIQQARREGLSLVHLATEPVTVREVARVGFNRRFDNVPDGVAPARYDFRTRHAALFGATPPYLQTKDDVLGEIRDFVAGHRSPQGVLR